MLERYCRQARGVAVNGIEQSYGRGYPINVLHEWMSKAFVTENTNSCIRKAFYSTKIIVLKREWRTRQDSNL